MFCNVLYEIRTTTANLTFSLFFRCFEFIFNNQSLTFEFIEFVGVQKAAYKRFFLQKLKGLMKWTCQTEARSIYQYFNEQPERKQHIPWTGCIKFTGKFVTPRRSVGDPLKYICIQMIYPGPSVCIIES